MLFINTSNYFRHKQRGTLITLYLTYACIYPMLCAAALDFFATWLASKPRPTGFRLPAPGRPLTRAGKFEKIIDTRCQPIQTQGGHHAVAV